MEAEQTPGRRRCSRCSSSVCGAHTPSRSDSPVPHRLAQVASEVEVDTGRSSAAVQTEGGWDTRNPEGQTTRIRIRNAPLVPTGNCGCFTCKPETFIYLFIPPSPFSGSVNLAC